MDCDSSRSREIICNLVLVYVLFLFASDVQASDNTTETLEDFGDIMQFALPLAGLGATFVADDPEGRKQFYKSYITAIGTTTTLKGVYSKLRPQSRSRTSFPSGHTTSAFAGAAFIDQRYGHRWGALAYTAAGITGYSRVRSENHFADDVVAGASIAIMSNWLWTTPYESNVTIMPILIGNGVGFALTVEEEVEGKKYRIKNAGLAPKYRYELALGGGGLKRNYITSPTASGTTFNLHDFERRDDPTTTANALLEWYVNKQNTVRFSFWPFESRDNGQFSQPVSFAGSTFPAATNINSEWRHYDIRSTYIYNFTPDSDWHLGLGASLSMQFTEIDLHTDNDSIVEEVDDQVLLPLLHASMGYRFTRDLTVSVEVNGISLSNDSQLDGNILARYRLNHYWDVGLGVGMYERNIDTSSLKNDLRYNTSFITLGYTFY